MITLRKALVVLPLASMATALPLQTREVSIVEPDLMQQQTETALPGPDTQQLGGQVASEAIQGNPSPSVLPDGNPADPAGMNTPPVVALPVDVTASVTDPAGMGAPPAVAPSVDATVPVTDPTGMGAPPALAPPIDATAPVTDPAVVGGAPVVNATTTPASPGAKSVPDGATDGFDPETKPTTGPPPPPPESSGGVLGTIKAGANKVLEPVKQVGGAIGGAVTGLASKLNPFS